MAETVRAGLALRQIAVRHATTLSDGQRMLSRGQYAALILDLTLPDGDGLDFAAALRTAGNDIPILMLTSKSSVPDRITGFKRGADDYLCKPFEVEELAERLQAILRRTHGPDRHVLQYADVRLDLATHKVQPQEIHVVLSAREAELLAYFMRHPQEALPRARVLREVWGDEAEDDSNVLNVYVNYLRNKIEAHIHPRLIHTVRGVGYILSTEEPDEFVGRPTRKPAQ